MNYHAQEEYEVMLELFMKAYDEDPRKKNHGEVRWFTRALVFCLKSWLVYNRGGMLTLPGIDGYVVFEYNIDREHRLILTGEKEDEFSKVLWDILVKYNEGVEGKYFLAYKFQESL